MADNDDVFGGDAATLFGSFLFNPWSSFRGGDWGITTATGEAIDCSVSIKPSSDAMELGLLKF